MYRHFNIPYAGLLLDIEKGVGGGGEEEAEVEEDEEEGSIRLADGARREINQYKEVLKPKKRELSNL